MASRPTSWRSTCCGRAPGRSCFSSCRRSSTLSTSAGPPPSTAARRPGPRLADPDQAATARHPRSPPTRRRRRPARSTARFSPLRTTTRGTIWTSNMSPIRSRRSLAIMPIGSGSRPGRPCCGVAAGSAHPARPIHSPSFGASRFCSSLTSSCSRRTSSRRAGRWRSAAVHAADCRCGRAGMPLTVCPGGTSLAIALRAAEIAPSPSETWVAHRRLPAEDDAGAQLHRAAMPVWPTIDAVGGRCGRCGPPAPGCRPSCPGR